MESIAVVSLFLFTKILQAQRKWVLNNTIQLVTGWSFKAIWQSGKIWRKKHKTLEKVNLMLARPDLANLKLKNGFNKPTQGLACLGREGAGNDSHVWGVQHSPSHPWAFGRHHLGSLPAPGRGPRRVHSKQPTSAASSVLPGLPSSASLDSYSKKRHVLIV